MLEEWNNKENNKEESVQETVSEAKEGWHHEKAAYGRQNQ